MYINVTMQSLIGCFPQSAENNMNQITPLRLQPSGLAAAPGLQSSAGHDLQPHTPCGKHM